MARHQVKSPCNNICTLGKDSVCLGCGRTVEEIANWSQLTESQAKAIINRLNNNKEHDNEKSA